MDETGPVTSEGERVTAPVFISYATSDRKDALAVCEAIERRGIQCWMASRDVGPGENYQEAIVAAIRGARAVVLVFSKAANDSDEIKKELSLASRFRIPLMALRVEEVEPSDAFAYELSTRQWVDAFDGWDKAIDALVNRLNGISAAGEPPRNAGTASFRRRRTRFPKGRIAAGLAALLALVAIAAALVWRPFAASEPLTVQVGAFQALGGVPADAPAAFQQELRAAFGDEHAVVVKDAGGTFTLGGSIRNVGDTMRYAVQLTDSRTGEMLWSGSRDIEVEAGAAAPQQAAERISWVVRCGLADAMEHPRRLPNRALSLYLQHCRMWFWGEDSGERALDVIRKVVEEAPDFSRGWSKLAENAARAALDARPENRAKLVATASGAARRALELDARNGAAYLALALLQPRTAWAKREELHEKSVLVRESDCACEHQNYGRFLLDVGRPGEAVSQLERAVDMQPRTPNANWWLMTAHYHSGSRDAGDRIAHDMAAFWTGGSLAQSLRLEQALARARWDEAAKLAPDLYSGAAEAPIVDAFAALASGQPARMAAARDALLRMEDESNAEVRVILLTRLGARERALELLRHALDQRRSTPAFLFDPQLAALRSDPAWVAMLDELGLVDYWRTSKKPPDFCKAADALPVCRTI